MKIVLTFNGNECDFQRALDSKDDQFTLLDSIYWEMDYGGDGSYHHTKYGNIDITVER